MPSEEAVVAALVARCIAARDHRVIDERDEAVDDLALSMERLVSRRLAETCDSDPRYASLDGVRTLTVEARGSERLYVLGALYLLEVRGHRMLPFEAHLTTETGAVSKVRIAGKTSAFALPQSERQFVRGVEGAKWRYCLDLLLAPV